MTPIDQPTPPPPKPGTVEFTNGTITLGFGLGVVPYWYIKTPEGITNMQALDHTLIAALRQVQQKEESGL